MRRALDDKGNRVWPLASSEVSADLRDGVILLELRYRIDASAHGEGLCPKLMLTPEQAVHLSSALQQQVLALTGSTFAFRGPPRQ
jgi:hypothetical protein